MRHLRVLDPTTAVLVVIDVQESYRQALYEYERVATAVARLVQGICVLDLPILVTEQYPKGLGRTVPEVATHFPRDLVPIEKTSLSCCGAPRFLTALDGLRRRQVLLAGIEAHACVSQTAHDLLARGYEVHLAHDSTSSRHVEDYRIGWAKMIGGGVIPATVEGALLELVQTAEAPEFKAIQKLIR